MFYGDSKMHLGVELEIDDGGEINSMAQQILNVANERSEHLYCKHDGSIDDGFELVTHPYGLADNAKETYDKAKKGNRKGRYVCLNLYNHETIEFRIFRGTLKYETLIATLELVHEICKQAIEHTDKDFEKMSWGDFVKGINPLSKPELVNYLKSKQLYIEGWGDM